ncbi:MAG: amidase, partial [Chloroflexota bacterium]|nr:amidase [Chloroflexota bacterium]
MSKVDESLAFVDSVELLSLYSSKEVSPVEVTDLYIDRIERLNGKLNAFLECTFDQARRRAIEAEAEIAKEETRPQLLGIPLGIKDLEFTQGIRTTGGSLVFENRIPDMDSIVVERVKSAGAVILGKTNPPELGLLGDTRNRLGDYCRNPWDISNTPGGSSGGAAAAIVAGMWALATGSDGGGSI